MSHIKYIETLTTNQSANLQLPQIINNINGLRIGLFIPNPCMNRNDLNINNLLLDRIMLYCMILIPRRTLHPSTYLMMVYSVSHPKIGRTKDKLRAVEVIAPSSSGTSRASGSAGEAYRPGVVGVLLS
ncbi:hypothetical protein DFH29DRAFT_1003191 [Suillus ampliporus]|nr:hypothetical protein DFH29DRAFT_1003191 [Suillus ampliporus]